VSAAVFFVIGAFASAGFAVLPPIPKYTVNMALTVGIGVTVVAVVIFTTYFGHKFKTRWQQLKDKMKKSIVYKF
jgi:aspartate/methionine/tyrosine aminotransferase